MQASPSELLQDLQKLEAELHHPGVRCSREQLERLLHPGFHEVGRSGRQYNRETVIQYLAAAEVQPNVESQDYAVTELAQGCSLLTYRSVHRQPDGALTEPALRSSLWLLTPMGWQLFYHQGTPAAAQG